MSAAEVGGTCSTASLARHVEPENPVYPSSDAGRPTQGQDLGGFIAPQCCHGRKLHASVQIANAFKRQVPGIDEQPEDMAHGLYFAWSHE